MSRLIAFLTPWEFSPAVLAACVLAAGLYARGLARARRGGHAASGWQVAAYFTGLGLIWLFLQSQLDYLSQHMFWVHRLQHLVLHHVGPFLMVLGAPHRVLPHGLPAPLRGGAALPRGVRAAAGGLYGLVQHPIVAPVLFAGLIYLWLIPAVHFDAMLSLGRYQLMNWSMALDGLLFWWLVLDPRPPARHGTPGYGVRIAMLWAVMLPQIALGAYITFHGSVLYSVYAVCGRAWPISPLTDQQIGGLLTWIPTSMMTVLAGLLVLRLWLRSERPVPRRAPLAGRVSTGG